MSVKPIHKKIFYQIILFFCIIRYCFSLNGMTPEDFTNHCKNIKKDQTALIAYAYKELQRRLPKIKIDNVGIFIVNLNATKEHATIKNFLKKKLIEGIKASTILKQIKGNSNCHWDFYSKDSHVTIILFDGQPLKNYHSLSRFIFDFNLHHELTHLNQMLLFEKYFCKNKKALNCNHLEDDNMKQFFEHQADFEAGQWVSNPYAHEQLMNFFSQMDMPQPPQYPTYEQTYLTQKAYNTGFYDQNNKALKKHKQEWKEARKKFNKEDKKRFILTHDAPEGSIIVPLFNLSCILGVLISILVRFHVFNN